ncbi:MAG: four helix bundle protein [Deltaproteobacteria bacterium]|nr:four helix bundle protein [Deltaproteobacteria bacterium]
MIKSYRDLLVWKRSMELVSLIYSLAQKFPSQEQYGLTSQIRRSAISIPSNIAEGQGRQSTKEFRQFLINARGSLCELETQILIASSLNYLNPEEVKKLLDLSSEIGKMINGLTSSLNRKITDH